MCRWTDEWLQRGIGRLLHCGVVLAAAVVLAGGIAYLVRDGAGRAEYSAFRGEPSHLRSFSGVLRGVAAGDAPSIIQFGLLLLIATPVSRVAFAVVGLALQRDRLYTAIAGTVLAVLVYSLIGRH